MIRKRSVAAIFRWQFTHVTGNAIATGRRVGLGESGSMTSKTFLAKIGHGLRRHFVRIVTTAAPQLAAAHARTLA